MASRAASLQISEDDIDDLLYLARTGETQELAKFLGAIASRLQTSEEAIILAAKDDFSGNNALHMTAANGHVETTQKLLSFLPAPSSPDADPHAVISHKNASGNTPLHWAALNGHLEVVKVLVMSANADPTITNEAGHDAVYEAELNDKKDVVEWLLGHCDSLEGGIGGGPEEDDNGTTEETIEPNASASA